jgi:hypothetical protein
MSSTSSRCFNCAERGHWSKQCPKPQALMCYNCQESGHISNTCPAGKYCHSCGDPNHLISVCPIKGLPVCYRCGIKGHLARQCLTVNSESTAEEILAFLSDSSIRNEIRCCFSCGYCGHADPCCNVGKSFQVFM